MTDPRSTSRATDVLGAPAAARRRWVRDAFHTIARRYDLLNHLLSGGVHLLWKKEAVREAALTAESVAVDVCCGTGDLLLRMGRILGPRGRAVGIDFAPGMLAVAATRLAGCAAVGLVCADAESLPLGGAIADAVTFAFGLRNVAQPERALLEACRILRPGGRLVVLEFGRPRSTLVGGLYDLYSNLIIPRLGGRLSGRPDAYRYLHDSIRRWPDPDTLAHSIRNSGFEPVWYRSLSGGIAVLHVGIKPGSGLPTAAQAGAPGDASGTMVRHDGSQSPMQIPDKFGS